MPCAACAIVRVAGLDRGWPLVPLVAFVPWATAGTAVVALLAVGLRRRLPALVAGASTVVLLVAVAPRALEDAGRPASGAAPLRVLTANLFAERASPAAVVALARRTRADVLSVQELTPEAARGLEKAGLRDVLPYAVLRAQPRFRGSGLYARRPLRAIRAPRTSADTAAAVLPLPRGPRVELLAVHAQAPSARRHLPAWRRDLRALPSAPARGAIRVLAGDFNATLDHRELRRVLARGYTDSAARAGAGLASTWPQGRRIPPAVTIDHVLVSERAAVGEVRVHAIAGSDHRAVVAELFLPPR